MRLGRLGLGGVLLAEWGLGPRKRIGLPWAGLRKKGKGGLGRTGLGRWFGLGLGSPFYFSYFSISNFNSNKV